MIWPGNLKKNKQISIPAGYLNGQSLEPLKNLRYGMSTAAHCGCGPISVYNAMRYLGKKVSLPRVMRELELYAAPFGAWLGTFPYAMGIYFWRRHLPCRMTWSLKTLGRADAGIIAYWTKRPIFSGAHLVFYEKTPEGEYIIYNRYSNRGMPYRYKDLKQLTTRGRLILGYVIAGK